MGAILLGNAATLTIDEPHQAEGMIAVQCLAPDGKDAKNGPGPANVVSKPDPLDPKLDADVATRKAAVAFLRPLAARGDARAQAGLAYLLEQGADGPADPAEVAALYRAAALAGVTFAQSALGNLYASGVGVPRYWSEAVRWWTSAAIGGDAKARLRLALAYAGGNGVDRNDATAECLLVGLDDEADALVARGDLAIRRQPLKDGAADAARFYMLATRQGNLRAQARLGLLLLEGQGGARDAAAAAQMLQAPAEAGDVSAQVALAGLFALGRGVEKDRRKAYELNRHAAAAGSLEAMNNLGALTEAGKFRSLQLVEATMWYSLAADRGSAEAARNLARILPRLTERQLLHARQSARRCVDSNWRECGTTPEESK
jgi:TPR repeat protein